MSRETVRADIGRGLLAKAHILVTELHGSFLISSKTSEPHPSILRLSKTAQDAMWELRQASGDT